MEYKYAVALISGGEEKIMGIFDTKEDADEFIELRRQARENFGPPKYKFGSNDEELPMAAEEGSDYQDQ